MELIDQLAREYGWSKSEILDEVFLDEAMEYLDLIQKSRVQNYYMLAIIASNPHTKKPGDLLKHLDEELSKLSLGSIMETDAPEAGAIDKLRAIFNKKTK